MSNAEAEDMVQAGRASGMFVHEWERRGRACQLLRIVQVWNTTEAISLVYAFTIPEPPPLDSAVLEAWDEEYADKKFAGRLDWRHDLVEATDPKATEALWAMAALAPGECDLETQTS